MPSNVTQLFEGKPESITRLIYESSLPRPVKQLWSGSGLLPGDACVVPTDCFVIYLRIIST